MVDWGTYGVCSSREERQLSVMLAQEVVDSDETWSNCELQETQIKLLLTDLVVGEIVREAIGILIHN